MGELAEGFLTVRAVVRLYAQVNAEMLSQVGSVGKGLGAMGTFMRLRLCVGLRVDLHVRLGEERQRATFTPAKERKRWTRTHTHTHTQRHF